MIKFAVCAKHCKTPATHTYEAQCSKARCEFFGEKETIYLCASCAKKMQAMLKQGVANGKACISAHIGLHWRRRTVRKLS